MEQLAHDELFTLYPDDETRATRFTMSEKLDANLTLAGGWAAVKKVAAGYFELTPAGPPPYSGHLTLMVAVLRRCLRLERLLAANDAVLAEMVKVLAAQNAEEKPT